MLSPFTAERVEPIVASEMTAAGLKQSLHDPERWFSPDGLPYGHSLIAPDSETEPAELRLLERVVGREMRCDILLHIFVSDLAGRPVLGRLAQRIAERTEGWVLAEFRTPPSANLLSHLENAGRCIRVDHDVYLDAAGMAAWNAHPDFHVIK